MGSVSVEDDGRVGASPKGVHAMRHKTTTLLVIIDAGVLAFLHFIDG